MFSSLSAEAEPFVPQSNTNEVGTTKDTLSTSLSNAINTLEFKGGVLLQTAKAVVSDVTGTRHAP